MIVRSIKIRRDRNWDLGFAAIALIVMAAAMLRAQDVIENGPVPAAKNAGRVVTLKEELAVRDGGRDLYFDWPRDIRAAPDGSFFVASRDQLLQFDASGRFLRNYFKKGQGPGEMEYAGGYDFDGQVLAVYSFPKILRFDLGGKFLGEFRADRKSGVSSFIQAYRGRYDFVKFAFPAGRAEAEIIDSPQTFVSVAGNGEEVRELASFPIKAYIMRSPGGGGAMDYMNRLLTASAGGGRLFISHTQDYLVKLYDPASDRVLRTFRRKYDRVRPTPEEEALRNKPGAFVARDKPLIRPAQKYSNDLRGLFVVEDRLWVLTSTVNPAKGRLVDVFDEEGRYLDSFYLPLPNNLAPERSNPIWISGNRLYLIESNPDETAVLRVYTILDPAQSRRGPGKNQ
jgi:hypothetical protein